jgi:hypothetical protein
MAVLVVVVVVAVLVLVRRHILPGFGPREGIVHRNPPALPHQPPHPAPAGRAGAAVQGGRAQGSEAASGEHKIVQRGVQRGRGQRQHHLQRTRPTGWGDRRCARDL